MLATYTFNSQYQQPTTHDLGLPNLRLLEGGTFEPEQHAAVMVHEFGQIRLRHFQWGLVPSWGGHSAMGKNRAFASAATIFRRPAFQESIRHRRCLVPADGFHVQKDITIGSPVYKLSLPNDPMFCFAGIHEYWTNQRGEEVHSFAIITTGAPRSLSQFGTRMPMILPRNLEKAWLNPDTNLTQIANMLQPLPDKLLKVEVVSTGSDLAPVRRKQVAA
jgi:putative SOS response-associated peptidase YedK